VRRSGANFSLASFRSELTTRVSPVRVHDARKKSPAAAAARERAICPLEEQIRLMDEETGCERM
jgi:hypothetical protein